MSEDNLTVHILRELREEIRSTRDEVRATNQRFDLMDRRFDRFEQTMRAEMGSLRDELRAEIVASDLRAATRAFEQTAAINAQTAMLEANFQRPTARPASRCT
jgi:hypothetical protein